MPKTTINRIGRIEKELPILRGVETNLKSYKSSALSFFQKNEDKKLNKALLCSNPDNYNQIDTLISYLAKHNGNKEHTFYFSQHPKNDSIYNQPLFSNSDKLKTAISKFLCDNENDIPNIIVVYNPVEKIKEVPKTENVDTAKTVETPIVKNEIDKGDSGKTKKKIKKENKTDNDPKPIKGNTFIPRFDLHTNTISWEKMENVESIYVTVKPILPKKEGDIEIINEQINGDATSFRVPTQKDYSHHYTIKVTAKGKKINASGEIKDIQLNCK